MSTPALNRSPRILHLISSLSFGGLERFAVRLAAHQRTQGMDAQIFTLKDGPLRPEAETARIPITILTGGKLQRILGSTLRFREIAPHIVHAHNVPMVRYAALAKRTTRAPIVLTLHGRGKDDAGAPSGSTWAVVDRIISVSDYVGNDMRERVGSQPIQTIRNGVEFATAQRSRSEVRSSLGLPKDQLVAITVARMDHLKGHETLLQAIALLPASTPEFTLLIAGDGPELAARRELAESLGLDEERVRFLGFRDDVPDLLASSDLFILPSYSEGLPLSVLEAMSHGLPVIATTVGGTPEVIRSAEEGMLVEPRDAKALSKAIHCLLTDKEIGKRMGATGRESVETEFDFGRMAHQYSEIYRQLTG